MRDLIQSYVNLELLPGPVQEHTYEFYHRKRLYLEHGWPDNFDGPRFNAALAAFEEQESADYDAEAPIRDIPMLEHRIENWQNIGGWTEEDKKEKMEELEKAKEAIKVISPDVLRRREERERSYEADHPFYN